MEKYKQRKSYECKLYNKESAWQMIFEKSLLTIQAFWQMQNIENLLTEGMEIQAEEGEGGSNTREILELREVSLSLNNVMFFNQHFGS